MQLTDQTILYRCLAQNENGHVTSDVAQCIAGFYRHLFESQTLLPHPVFLFANAAQNLRF